MFDIIRVEAYATGLQVRQRHEDLASTPLSQEQRRQLAYDYAAISLFLESQQDCWNVHYHAGIRAQAFAAGYNHLPVQRLLLSDRGQLCSLWNKRRHRRPRASSGCHRPTRGLYQSSY
jgi:hypothetical protein